MADQLLHKGRVIMFVPVNDEPSEHGCLKCVGREGFDVCGALPDGCATAHVHYEEVA